VAKAQWLAADGTVGQPPTGLDNLLTADGQLLSDWQIVTDAGASGGKALKLNATSNVRRRLAVPGVAGDYTHRIDIRGRYYQSVNNANGMQFALRADASGEWYTRLSTVRKATINKYNPAYGLQATGASAFSVGQLPGWLNFRYTWDPAQATDKHRAAYWLDGDSDATATVVVADSTVDPVNILGDRIAFGFVGGHSNLIDWITVGVDEDADVTPGAGGQTEHALEGSAVISVSASGDLTTTGTKGVSLTLYSGSTPVASLAGITACWWDTDTPSAFAAPAVIDTVSTDASGVFKLNLSASALTEGLGFLLLYKAQSPATDDLIFAGRLPIGTI
jgi:hypothetical protein